MVRTGRTLTPRGAGASLRPEGIGLAETGAGFKWAAAALAGLWTSRAFRPRFRRGAFARLLAGQGYALDRDPAALAVLRRAALDALARPFAVGDVGGDFGAQSRDMLAPALGGGGLRRRAARWRVAFEPAARPASLHAPAGPAPDRARGPRAARGPGAAARPGPAPRRGSSRTIRPASKLAFASLASFTPNWSRSTRVRTSMISPSGQIAKLERAERDADQAVDRKSQVLEDLLDLAVLAFPQTQGEPGVRTLLTVELRLDAAIVDAVDDDAVARRSSAAWSIAPCARTR